MLFCSKCGSLLRPLEGKMKCTDCGVSQEEGILKDTKKRVREVEVVEEHESNPVVAQECPKCKKNKAYHWSIQTRSSDEPETLFFKCVECKHQWREYS